MIPRHLPKLVTDALAQEWRVDLRPNRTYLSAYFTSRDGLTNVHIEWSEGRVDASSIDGTPTPYAQCTRLIRSPEGATS